MDDGHQPGTLPASHETDGDAQTPPAELVASRRATSTIDLNDALEAPHRTPRLLRARVGWYLLALDCACFLASTAALWPPRPWQLLALLELCTCLGGVGKLYRSRLRLSILDDLPYLAGAVFLCLLTELSLEALDVVPGRAGRQLAQMALLLTLLVGGRATAYAVVRHTRRAGLIQHRVLVLGAGRIGTQLVRNLRQHPEYGLTPVAYWDRRASDNLFTLDVPLYGADVGLPELIQRSDVRLVIIAFGRVPEPDLVDVLRTCDRLHCEIYVVPRLFELQATNRAMDSVWGIPVERIHRAPFRTVTWRLKRPLDIVVAATALAILSPVLLACWAAVRWESGAGVIFKQERLGLDGRRLTLYKFRTMRSAGEHDSATTWTIANDSRVGRVGRFLRSTSLDELPQLWNVLIGDMSLVGPRPERPHFADEFARTIPRYTSRHRVPAGLTGWAQIHGLRGDTSIEERARFDNTYVENWTLWGDVKIMLRTIQQILGRKGR